MVLGEMRLETRRGLKAAERLARSMPTTVHSAPSGAESTRQSVYSPTSAASTSAIRLVVEKVRSQALGSSPVTGMPTQMSPKGSTTSDDTPNSTKCTTTTITPSAYAIHQQQADAKMSARSASSSATHAIAHTDAAPPITVASSPRAALAGCSASLNIVNVASNSAIAPATASCASSMASAKREAFMGCSSAASSRGSGILWRTAWTRARCSAHSQQHGHAPALSPFSAPPARSKVRHATAGRPLMGVPLPASCTPSTHNPGPPAEQHRTPTRGPKKPDCQKPAEFHHTAVPFTLNWQGLGLPAFSPSM
mmetsp:Transcript_27334/g.55877  ORF Transcript_27334/g.55877 Transcript_27334/m.55877 type:complete len:309 (-) Transcript_27334:1038-1964(-)